MRHLDGQKSLGIQTYHFTHFFFKRLERNRKINICILGHWYVVERSVLIETFTVCGTKLQLHTSAVKPKTVKQAFHFTEFIAGVWRQIEENMKYLHEYREKNYSCSYFGQYITRAFR